MVLDKSAVSVKLKAMEYVLAAFTLGLTGGLKPGPLSVYVIHVTLSRSEKAGFFASLAPFVSDGPIILASFLMLSQAKQFNTFVALISLAGAAYLVWLAYKIFFVDNVNPAAGNTPASFLTAVKINLLNPVPYIFWTTVGGAYLIKGDLKQAIIFVVVMLGTLSLTKFSVATSIKMLGQRFSAHAYGVLLKLLALLLLGFAIKLGLDGYQLMA